MKATSLTLSRRRILAGLAGAGALLPLAACGTVATPAAETEAKDGRKSGACQRRA